MQIVRGTCNWPHTGGARLIEVAANAGGTVSILFHIFRKFEIPTEIVNVLSI